MRMCFMVGLGGFLGSVSRYLLSLLPLAGNSGFPWMTLGINVTGSLLIGVLVGLTESWLPAQSEWVALLKIGFCGGFTTFSTFSLETMELVAEGRIFTAAVYSMASVALCLCAIYLGKMVFTALFS